MAGAPQKPPREGAALRFLYGTAFGRMALRALTAPALSRAVGAFMDSGLSKPFIAPFIRRCGIDMEEYLRRDFASFNDFFTRDIVPERRPIDRDPASLIAPCDGFLSVYEIEGSAVMPVKHSAYTVGSLLRDEDVSARFTGGMCLVFRLCPDNFHRYCYIDSGVKGRNVRLEGRLNTVRPIALEKYPIFTENAREYTLIETENFGEVVQMEVGAMFVGKIKNHHEQANVRRGEEKGMFLFGGSTVIVLLKKDAADIDLNLIAATRDGLETPVKMGERIGTKN